VLELAQRGLALNAADAVQLKLQILRASALHALGRASESLVVLAGAAPLATEPDGQARLELTRAAALRKLDRQVDALDALARAEAGARASQAPALLAEIEYQRGSVMFPIGDVDGSLRAHRASIDHARAAGTADTEARALSGIADAHYAAGRIAEARASFDRAEKLARQLGMTGLALSAEGMLAFMSAFDLELEQCVRRCLDVAVRAQQSDALQTELFTRTGACFALVCLARWPELHAAASRATALAEAIGARRFEALARGYWSLSHSRAGRIVEAETQLGLARGLCHDSGPAFSGGVLVAAELALTVDAERRRQLLMTADQRLGPRSLFHSALMCLVGRAAAALELCDVELMRTCVATPRPSGDEAVPLWELVCDVLASAADATSTGTAAAHSAAAAARRRAQDAQLAILAW
jgi:tetratricopeptide (TPR) repeat protein